jgi:hypothetical protein
MTWDDELNDLDVFEGVAGVETDDDLKTPEEKNAIDINGEDEFSDPVLDIDYSMLSGSFSNAIGKVKHIMKKNKRKNKKRKPLEKDFYVKEKEKINIGGGRKQIGRIIVPRDRSIKIENISEFILSDKPEKKIGYYKGEKLKELIITIDNTNGADFNLELFNPSMPLDYLQSSSGNLNDRITVAGQNKVSYSDLLFNILANPTLIANARFVATGLNVNGQKMESLVFTNKAVDGETRVAPIQLDLNIDVFQAQANIIVFDINEQLNRVFIPDGMDVIKYKVLPGNSVTFCFYYKQKQIKKLFFKEATVKRLFLDEMKELL